MASFLNFRRRRHMVRPVTQQIGARQVYVRQEPDWAAAWPRVDDWFKPEAFFIEQVRRRLVIT